MPKLVAVQQAQLAVLRIVFQRGSIFKRVVDRAEGGVLEADGGYH